MYHLSFFNLEREGERERGRDRDRQRETDRQTEVNAKCYTCILLNIIPKLLGNELIF